MDSADTTVDDRPIVVGVGVMVTGHEAGVVPAARAAQVTGATS